MNKQKKQMAVKYSQLGSGQGVDSYFERSLDLIFSPGCFTVEIDHTNNDVGLPVEYCGCEHYFVGNLVVTDSGTAGHKQENRVTGQQLTITSREDKETKVFTRTYADGKWTRWNSLARTGMYNNISTTDELLATVGSLVDENTRAKQVEEDVKHSAVDISSLSCNVDNEHVTITGNSMDGETIHSVEIPVATTKNAGVMTSVDKKCLNDLLLQSNAVIFENGGIDVSGTLSNNNQRIRTAFFLSTPFSYSLKEGYSVVCVLKYDTEGNFVEHVAVKNSYEKDEFLYKISFKKNDGSVFEENENPIKSYTGQVLSEIANIEQMITNNTEEIFSAIGFYLKLEKGSINPTNGNYSFELNRARSVNFLQAPMFIKTNDEYLAVHAVKYNKDGQFLNKIVLSTREVNITENDDCLYKLTFKRIDNGNITNLNDVIAESKTSFVKKIDDALTRVEIVANDLSRNTNKIEELFSLKNIAEQLTIDGLLPISRSIANLKTLPDGNVGCEKVSEFSATTYFKITNTWNDTHKFVLSAVVVEISNPSLLGFNTQTAVSFNCNYYTDNNYKNNISQELVKLDENTYLLYDLSGKCVNGNGDEVLPSTSYVRVSANTDVNVAIKKFYCAAVDYNGDITTYRECLISTALADYVWKDTLVSYKAVIDRNLSAGIAFWGSSSTEGDWVKNVAANLDMPYYWGGSGGENIWAIMGRMGVLPLRIETPITIPASSLEIVELPNNYKLKVRWKGVCKDATIWTSSSVPPEKLLVNPCYIAGVKGNLIGSGASNNNETLKFQRLEDGVAVTTREFEPIYTFGFRETRDCVWFLACHFNGGQSSTEELVELYKKMYDASESKKVLILGRHKVANGTVTSPTLAELQEQESALEDEFGLMFFNTREYMCGKGFERYKELYPTHYTTTDVSHAAQGITPDCMYESAVNVHFNTRGYAVLTEAITNLLIQLGYNLFRAGGDMKHPMY